MPVLDSNRIVAALRGAFAREESRQALLRIAAEKIRAAGPPYTSIYLYMLHGNELVFAWVDRDGGSAVRTSVARLAGGTR